MIVQAQHLRALDLSGCGVVSDQDHTRDGDLSVCCDEIRSRNLADHDSSSSGKSEQQTGSVIQQGVSVTHCVVHCDATEQNSCFDC